LFFLKKTILSGVLPYFTNVRQET